ncbi:MAG: hypothetical protein GXO48_01125 [Chlorobi bacterium]|nr:hypothetical protein [Chlorobiota bacterium]
MSNGIKPFYLFISKILTTFLLGFVALSLWFIIRYVYGIILDVPVPSYLNITVFSLFLLYLVSVIITLLIVVTIVFDYNFLIAFLGQLVFGGIIAGIIYAIVKLSKATDSEAQKIADAIITWIPDVLLKNVISGKVSLTLVNSIKLVVSSVVFTLISYWFWSKWRVYGIRKLFTKA